MRYAYDMLGNRIHQLSMEAGARWMLNDVAGKPIRAWDSRGHNFTTTYDALRRPVGRPCAAPRLRPAHAEPRHLVDRIEYGEGLTDAEALNLRTRIYRHFDSAGVATNARLDVDGNPIEAYDFKGNLLHSTRRLVSDYTAIPDWGGRSATRRRKLREQHALRRAQPPDPVRSPRTAAWPRASHDTSSSRSSTRPTCWSGWTCGWSAPANPPGCSTPTAEPPSPVGVANIDYDAKGQRLRIDYKNGASTLQYSSRSG